MNLEVTSIPQRVPALTSLRIFACLLVLSPLAFAKAKSDSYFSLPTKKSKLQIPQANLTFSGKKFKLAAGKQKVKAPKVDAQKYFFEKQTFLTARRDQAIKLLRQELNSGYRKNRDNVLLRLGQLYTEKYMELNYHEIERYNDKVKEFEKTKKGKRPRLDTRRSRRYLSRALKTLTRLEREYPRHRRMDEILFFIGFVNMEFGRTTKGAQYLERMVRRYPKSRKYNEAILYLADYYFDRQRFKPALTKYRILLRKKDTDLYYYALYKTAWCQLNLGQPGRALTNMKTVVSKLEGAKEKLKFNLREQAINDLALFYADSGKVDEGFRYYVKVLGKDKAYEKLKLMAKSVHNRAQGNSSIQAHAMLLNQYGDSLDAPEYSMAIYESQVRLGYNAKAVKTLVEALDKYGEESSWAKSKRSDNPKEVQEKLDALRKDSTNAAYFFHRTAQKSKRKNFYGYGLQLYEAVGKAFPNHPDKRKIIFYQAEILYQQKRFLAAADRYMIIAKQKPKDKLAEEAAYNALLSVDQLTANSKVKRFTEKEKRAGNFEKKSIPKGEQRFIDVSEFYLKEYSNFKRATDVRFRIAGIYYRYHHFDKAAPIFEEIATKHPKHKNATTSAHLLLDIYNIQKNYAALGSTAGKFANEKKLGNSKFRAEMRGFQDQIGFKSIEKFEKEKNWDKAGEAYYNYYRSNPRGKLAQQALYNSVVSYEKTQNLAKQQEVSALFMKRYPKHPYNKRLLLLQAKRAEEGYDFEQAQKLYQKYQQKNPKGGESKKALYNAAVFAEISGKTTTALRLYDRYLQQGRVSAKERRAIRISQAELYRRQGNWRKVAQIYGQLSRQSPTLADRISILGKLADLYGTYGRRGERAATLTKIRNLTRNRKNTKEFGSDAKYIAEARFRNIDAQSKRYRRLKLRLPPNRLVRDMKRKQDALKKLDNSYDGVVSLGDPEWGVAALSERAEHYSHFVASYRGIKIPRAYKGAQRKELQKQLKQLDTELIVPFEAKSKELAQLCRTKAVEFHISGRYATRCRNRVVSKANVIKPSGLLPRPSYWTTRWGNLGVANR